jgi:hypothetical protein
MNIQQFVNVGKYVRNYLSPILRKPRLLSFLYALVEPLRIYREKLTTVTYPRQEREARSNSQVIKFEKILNTRFSSGTSIYINEFGNIDKLFIFNQLELKPKYLYNNSENKPLYLRNRKEYFGGFDFTVNVPQALYDSSLLMIKAAVEKYKLAGVNYQIRPY